MPGTFKRMVADKAYAAALTVKELLLVLKINFAHHKVCNTSSVCDKFGTYLFFLVSDNFGLILPVFLITAEVFLELRYDRGQRISPIID